MTEATIGGFVAAVVLNKNVHLEKKINERLCQTKKLAHQTFKENRRK